MDIDLDKAASSLQEQVDDVRDMVDRAASGDKSVTANEMAAKFGALSVINSNILIALLEERDAGRDTP